MKGKKFLVLMSEEDTKVLFPVVVHDMDNFMRGRGKSTFWDLRTIPYRARERAGFYTP